MVSHIEPLAEKNRNSAAYVTQEQVREHYLIEKELANRLRRATKDERRRLYHVVYDERSQCIPQHPLVMRAADPAAQARAVQPQARVLRHFANRHTVFLEIGAGDGALALEMSKWVKQVFAIDVSGELVKNIVSPPNFEFRLFDGFELPLALNSIDLAYSNDVLEHLHPEDAQDQLHSLLHVLRADGKYICVTPNRLSGPHDVSRNFDTVATGFHLKEYTIGELAALFQQVGFRRVNAFVSMRGQMLLPPLSIVPFIKIENLIARVSSPYQRKIASLLAAVKVIAIK
ncbi:MAG TPA: class I SAM-dependent methyltransferase [Anaerolineae bacterium]|nr:class I SAM-dependent methyltransferase [Anaerolineae bacterium]